MINGRKVLKAKPDDMVEPPGDSDGKASCKHDKHRAMGDVRITDNIQ